MKITTMDLTCYYHVTRSLLIALIRTPLDIQISIGCRRKDIFLKTWITPVGEDLLDQEISDGF